MHWAAEEISKVDASVAFAMSVNNSLVCYGLQDMPMKLSAAAIFNSTGTG
jgi:hypothetical protein